MMRVAVCVLLTAVGTVALWWERGRLEGTTLASAWYWTLGSLWAVGVAVLFLGGEPEVEARGHYLYAAGVTTFCPVMALLGAKRPQDRAWQFVVFTLLVVLLVPGAQALVFAGHARLELHAAWGWFLWVLVGLGLFHRTGTRFWLAGLLWPLGQILLLAGQLPIVRERIAGFPLAGLSALVLGLVASEVNLARARKPAYGWNCVWRDFRDGFGTLWALRVLERFNAAAEMADWSVRLRWSGFIVKRNGDQRAAAITETEELPPAAETSLLGLLRRFVTSEWIEARLRCGNR